MTQWIEDWFGSKYYSLLYKHRDDKEARLFLDNLISFLKIPAGSRIIDCGCGKGRHSVYLGQKGFSVTGVDLSEQNISESKKYEGNNLEFFVHDIRNLFRVNYYDVALNLFTSFGYFENDAENNKVVRATAATLKKGGWFVLDFMNAEKEIGQLRPEEKFQVENIDFRIARSASKKCIMKQIHISEKGNDCSYRENVRAYGRQELETFFRKNGLEVVHLFGNYELEPFVAASSDRLILIGRKK